MGRSHFTTVTPLPDGITRETVLRTLHAHTEMIDLNPLVIERHPIRPPPEASPEEAHCQWYSISDKISYVPGIYTSTLTFNGCFHDLPDGLQTHIFAPMGLEMRGRWTMGGSLPGEERLPQELGMGVPKQGLWLREDVDMKCNKMLSSFVRKTTKKAHHTLVDRLIEKSHLKETAAYNKIIKQRSDAGSQYSADDYSDRNTSPAPLSHRQGQSIDATAVSIRSNGGSVSSMGARNDPRYSHQSSQFSQGQRKSQTYTHASGSERPPLGSHPSYELEQTNLQPAELASQAKSPIAELPGETYYATR